jgi:hypothetical protein
MGTGELIVPHNFDLRCDQCDPGSMAAVQLLKRNWVLLWKSLAEQRKGCCIKCMQLTIFLDKWYSKYNYCFYK